MLTYDAKVVSDAEIIAPGCDKTAPHLQARALRAGMMQVQTRDAIMTVTGGRTEFPEEDLDMILRASAALVAAQRAGSAQSKTQDAAPKRKALNEFTAEDINALNRDYYRNRG